MAPIQFSGALTGKKKDELMSIATALDLKSDGTRDELIARLKKHVENNADELENNPMFQGLVKSTRRSRLSQPPEEPIKRKPLSRRVLALEPVGESSPQKETDMRNVSLFLKHPEPEEEEEEEDEEDKEEEEPELRQTRSVTSRSGPGGSPVSQLKPASTRSIKGRAKPTSAVVHAEEPSISAILTARVRNLDPGLQRTRGFTHWVRATLSSSDTLFWTTALAELLSIRWQFEQYPQVPFHVPTVSAFVLFQAYLLPSLILPYLLGKTISFRTQKNDAWDPLTANIVRFAAHIAIALYFIPGNVSQTLGAPPPVPTPGLLGMTKEETLAVDAGIRWRILLSGIALAFSFAEVAQTSV